MGLMGAFWGTRAMEIVKKHDSGGLVWKRIKLTTTRKANAKKRLRRVWQWRFLNWALKSRRVEELELEFRVLGSVHLLNEAVLKACAEPPPSKTVAEKASNSTQA
ncbi:hypothetical protein Scep_020927 [Stephania cephalantha]|uniref:Uncharacterized protein n=1 Tax=Stephania cephalantha TaxID=152367 RepID=A0AAP0HWD8_9MAGN